ncbi:MAG: DUF5131 family protein, partial [Planctomycetota bacterium]
MTTTSIEWTQATWNPVTGCTRASAGCDHCYAVAKSHRLGSIAKTRAKYGGLTVLNDRGDRHFNGTVRTHEDALSLPLRRKKPTIWFVNSMSDLFHRDVPFDFIDRVFMVMALCSHHTFQVLTKRPHRMAEYLTSRVGEFDRILPVMDAIAEIAPGVALSEDMGSWITDGRWSLRNVWYGTSIEDQAAANFRIPYLLNCPLPPGGIRFVSCEPLLGPVDLSGWFTRPEWGEPNEQGLRPLEMHDDLIHWLILGVESRGGRA